MDQAFRHHFGIQKLDSEKAWKWGYLVQTHSDTVWQSAGDFLLYCNHSVLHTSILKSRLAPSYRKVISYIGYDCTKVRPTSGSML